ELGVAQAHRHDGGHALADVLAEEVLLLLLHEVLAARVLVDGLGERLLEALLVHAALARGDAVGEAVDALVEAGVPLERDFDLLVVLRLLEVHDLLEQGLLRGIEVTDEVDDAAGVLVVDLLLVARPLVLEADLEALVEEGVHLQALDHRLRAELGLVEDRAVGPERDRGAGAAAGRVADDRQLRDDLAAVAELHPVAFALAVDLDDQLRRQGVDHRHAHAVQTARDLVATAVAELSAAVQDREGDFDARLLLLGMDVGGDAPAVVDHAAAPVGEEGDVDAVAVARHRLVDGVVDDLPDEVVQTARTSRSDVHTGPLADRFEALQDGEIFGPVRRRTPTFPPVVTHRLHRHGRALPEHSISRHFGR